LENFVVHCYTGIAQRGDNEEESCTDCGNFIELLNLTGDISDEFKSKRKI